VLTHEASNERTVPIELESISADAELNRLASYRKCLRLLA